MTVRVLLFAHYTDAAGGREHSVSLPGGATLATLAAQLEQQHPALTGLLSHGRAAVNAEFADARTPLADGDEVAFLPPVSGGSVARVLLTHEPLDVAIVSALVEDAEYGAVVTFAGTVRNHARGQSVRYLEYEAYAPLAEKELLALVERAEVRWPVRCAVHHRLGRVDIGEASVVAAVGSAHRAEAFAACAWLMDTLKATVPIWKKEYAASGAHWVEGPDAVPALEALP